MQLRLRFAVPVPLFGCTDIHQLEGDKGAPWRCVCEGLQGKGGQDRSEDIAGARAGVARNVLRINLTPSR